MGRPAAIAISVVLGTTGCMVGPNYRRPDLPTPPTFGELAPVAPAAGRSDVVTYGTPTTWWQSFIAAGVPGRRGRAHRLLARASDARAAREAVRANQRAVELARSLYGQGLTDFLTVLIAEQSVFTSQDSLAQTERDVALTLVSLYKALGGGWDSAVGSGDDTVTVSTRQ